MVALFLCAVLAADPVPHHDEFAKAMSGVEFVGTFTVDGIEGSPKKETYTIRKVEKLPQGDLWRFTARIRYGETDVELPMEFPVLWAGKTPVITLDNVWLPGLGTFSARVMIHDNHYTGTWRHDDKGGLMFGQIKPIEDAKPIDEANKPPQPEKPATGETK